MELAKIGHAGRAHDMPVCVCRSDAVLPQASQLTSDLIPEHSDALTAQAVCCALLFAVDTAERAEDVADYLSGVQEHLETAGHADMAQDVAYSLKLAKRISKASTTRPHIGRFLAVFLLQKLPL